MYEYRYKDILCWEYMEAWKEEKKSKKTVKIKSENAQYEWRYKIEFMFR